MARTIGGETILVPVRSHIVDLRCIFTLNPSGAFLWAQLARPRTVAQLATALRREFAVDTARAARDTERLVRRLVREGCAQRVGTGRRRSS